MQANFIQDGIRVDYTPAGAVDAGAVVVVNGRVRIAERAIAANALGSLTKCGVFAVAKVTGAIVKGDRIYWDAVGNPVSGTAGTGAATGTAEAGYFMGFADAAAASGDYTVRVQLVDNDRGSLADYIPDPGNAGAIPVTRSGYVPLVTGSAQTRTLADPTFPGQQLLLFVTTDGGTVVITSASGVNQTGHTTITMAEINDSVLFVAVGTTSGGLVWRIAGGDGAATS